ncbi:MAG: aminomethyl-transferring glycine dehydrogenase subunit GcvPB [Aigarchaeota archaeon]|nr:aminomethyl-transferring glycine dehydrogenase subunit GcvPB [Aigarchaeota archaeon]
MYKQSRWSEPLVFELGRRGAVGHLPPSMEKEIEDGLAAALESIPPVLRRGALNLPECSEPEVVRHFTRLSEMNYGVSVGSYPLGSCTMKYSPVINERLASLDKVKHVHPLQDESLVQGSLEVLFRLDRMLCELTGMDKFSFTPGAGAHGEFLGCLIMRAHSEEMRQKRTKVIVPDSAHGTNPASAAMAGFEVEVVKSDSSGCVDVQELERLVDEQTAGLMLTNPNTLGVFEREIERIVEIVHGAGGLLYYDGANLNALMGKVRPGDMGFDIVHLNCHKTFSTPHGGGGPGGGPVGVKEELERYLPIPTVDFDEGAGRYFLNYNRPRSVGRIKMFYGNFSVYVKTYAYLLLMGGEGLRLAAEASVLGSNYLLSKLRKLRGVSLPYDPGRPRKHEFVLSLSRLTKETGVRALNVAKRLLDFGVHAPTIYFPLTVDEAFMVEPTETESKRELDIFAGVMEKILEEAYRDPQKVLGAPYNTAVSRVDEARASHPRTICLSWRMWRKKREKPLS